MLDSLSFIVTLSGGHLLLSLSLQSLLWISFRYSCCHFSSIFITVWAVFICVNICANATFEFQQGVWIWGKPVDGFTPDGDPIKVLVLDTEGLGATDEEQNHDVRIFSLAILLASYFIYNSQQSIDETKLNDLSLVINLTKNIQIKAGGGNDDTDPEEYAQYFPTLMWVVRDFTLQLVDADSEPITSKDYLEKALQNQKGFSEAIDKKNRIRRLLKSFFKERDCCTMIRPLTKEDQL